MDAPEDMGHHAPSVAMPASETNGDLANPVAKPPTEGQKRSFPKKRRPNYGQIHSKPLPLATHALPAFHPTNPISLLRLAYVYLSQFFTRPTAHPDGPYVGRFSLETRSVHVTDPRHVRALWEMGFFGKGTLSRSEPSWIDREKARLQATRKGGGTAEEVTNARREARRQFKLERARAERERIEKQRLVEQGRLKPDPAADTDSNSTTGLLDATPISEQDSLIPTGNDQIEETVAQTTVFNNQTRGRVPDAENIQGRLPPDTRPNDPITLDVLDESNELEVHIENQEHLQLTLEEAFFLTYGLGVLEIQVPQAFSGNSELGHSTQQTPSSFELLKLFAAHGAFPPRGPSEAWAPDDQFLLNYVTYHHFRSLGWVVRSGVKFAVDWLLYQRGPVFSHAEFALIIVPSYTDAYWSSEEGRLRRRVKGDKDWWWLHCVNRVQSAVLKTLVLIYIDIPPPSRQPNENVGALLRSYKLREFVMKRWVMNRSRD